MISNPELRGRSGIADPTTQGGFCIENWLVIKVQLQVNNFVICTDLFVPLIHALQFVIANGFEYSPISLPSQNHEVLRQVF